MASGGSDVRQSHLTVDSLARTRDGPGPHARMASGRAQLRILGSFGLTDREGLAVSLRSPRAQSLLAYLALHRDAPQSRRRVSFVLWPDSSESQALNNLRQLVHQVRYSWPDAEEFLLVDASTLALKPGIALDVDEYENALAAAVAADQRPESEAVRAAFERAAALYQGDLLPGCYDDWVVPGRSRLIERQERLLDRLIGLLEQQGDYGAAIEYAQQRLRLDPLDERVSRWLMRLHTLNQDRSGALLVYRTCVAELERELGVQPDPATAQLYEHILRLEPGALDAVASPSGIEAASATTGPPRNSVPLIGRHLEWALALKVWGRMIGGEAQFLLISGEAGIGKSRLAAELCEWAGRQGIKSARARAYTAEGRLAYAAPADWLRSEALAAILPRLQTATLTEISRLLPELLSQRPDVPRPSSRMEDWQRQAFFQALATAFRSADQPLLLVLDDLQWCDAETLEWLHFLLRSHPAARVLIVGTLRSHETDPGDRLASLMAELADAGQLSRIELGPLDPAETSKLAARVAGRPLLREEARLIQSETEGNPLFVLETVRAGLIHWADGRAEGTSSSAQVAPGAVAELGRLPAKVHAVIASRLALLSEPARQLASVAATVGRAFTLEVVRESSGTREDILVQGLDELLRRQIVRELGGGSYDFTHDKIREVAYAEMTEARRRMVHRHVAEGLERVRSTAREAVAAQIAAHYADAGMADQAVPYYQLAAEVAQRVGANQEAMTLVRRGLAVLETLPPSADRDARELGLQTGLGVSLVATEGYGAPEVMSVYARSRELCQRLGRPPSPPSLRALAIASMVHGKIEDCYGLGKQLLSMAERDNDPVLRVQAHYVIAMSHLATGSVVPARSELEASLAHYDRVRSAAHISQYSQDPAVVCLIRLSLALWTLGDPAGSASRRSESLGLAEELTHPFTLCYALIWDAVLQSHRGDAALARSQADAAMSLSRDHRMPHWRSMSTVIHGWAVAEMGDIEAGIDEMRKAMADFKAIGTVFMRPFQLGLLAEQYGRLGNIERGLALIAEAVASVERTNVRWCEAELFRRKGDLHAKSPHHSEAEAAYKRAVEVARSQGARSLELRSATRLAAVWLGQSRDRDGAHLLETVLRGFDPEAEMPDLEVARTLLGQIGTVQRPGPN